MAVTLERGRHVYTNDDGRVYTSVTEVLGGLYRGAEAPRGARQRAADRGTVVHSLIAKDIAGAGESFGQFLGERAAAQAWLRAREARVEAVEKTVHRDDWRIAGTLDVIACVRPPERWHPLWMDRESAVVDWKTGAAGELVAAQLAAYRAMARACLHDVLDCAPLVAVQLGSDGRYKEHWFTGSAPDRLWFSALTLHRERVGAFMKAFAPLR